MNMRNKLVALKSKLDNKKPEPAFHVNLVISSPVYIFDLTNELPDTKLYTDPVRTIPQNSKNLVSNGYQSPYFFPSNPNFYNYKDLLELVENKANLISDIKYKIQYYWYVIYEKQGKQKWHSHKDPERDSTKLSGVYYSKIDENSSPIVFRDGTDKNIKFYPKLHQLILFHSYIEHAVLENASNNSRVAFAFNFEYAP